MVSTPRTHFLPAPRTQRHKCRLVRDRGPVVLPRILHGERKRRVRRVGADRLDVRDVPGGMPRVFGKRTQRGLGESFTYLDHPHGGIVFL